MTKKKKNFEKPDKYNYLDVCTRAVAHVYSAISGKPKNKNVSPAD